MSLAGIICVRNGTTLDYPWREAGESLLQVCDELVISDCDSDDDTRQQMDQWAARDSRITLCNFPWTNPVRTSDWYPGWVNYVRQHAKSDHIIHMDADEVLHEEDRELVREAAKNRKVLFFKRLNFWKSPSHLIPDGECCGTKVLRMARANMPIPSDYPYEPAAQTMAVAEESAIRVFHYGFLRKREAMEKKAKVVQTIWAGEIDPRLVSAFADPSPWMENPVVAPWVTALNDYAGSHPKVIHAWLEERGYHL